MKCYGCKLSNGKHKGDVWAIKGLRNVGNGCAMHPHDTFAGFSPEVFDCCKASSSIKYPIAALESLCVSIEPRVQRLNARLHGVVSRPKVQGKNEYNEWAWLMFTTATPSEFTGRPLRAHDYAQLTVNVCDRYLFAGLWLKRAQDILRLRHQLENARNELIFDQIVNTLAGREWIIQRENEDKWFDPTWYYDEGELRGALLDPKLRWINARFERDDPVVRTPTITNRIVAVFKELFNVYALAVELPLIRQPPPHGRVAAFTEIVVDTPTDEISSDEETTERTLRWLSTMGGNELRSHVSVPSKHDQYRVKRTAMRLNLTLHTITDVSGARRVVYLDPAYTRTDFEARVKQFDDFRARLDVIAAAMGTPKDFIQVGVLNPLSDARYLDDKHVVANLLRYEKNPSLFFWLFAVARETAYIKEKRLSYPFIRTLRDLLQTAMSRLKLPET